MSVTRDVIRAVYPGLDLRGQGAMARDAAFDLYLAFLSTNDVWDQAGLVFKGGTAVRKFHCDPRQSCRRRLLTKPCPEHPDSPGSAKIKGR